MVSLNTVHPPYNSSVTDIPTLEVGGFQGTYTRLPVSGSVQNEPASFAVTIISDHAFTPANTNCVPGCGKFSPVFIDGVRELLNEPRVRLQASCTICGPQQQKAKVKTVRYGLVSLPCEVSIILYGPRDLTENVGEFFQDLDMYLQDPDGCDWDVAYCNPHRLSSLNIDDCPMTSELGRPGTEIHETLFQSIPGESDVFDVLDVHQHLPEASQPALILSSLKK